MKRTIIFSLLGALAFSCTIEDEIDKGYSLKSESVTTYEEVVLKERDPKFPLAYIIHSGFISGYQNRYGDNLKPPTNVYHRMTA